MVSRATAALLLLDDKVMKITPTASYVMGEKIDQEEYVAKMIFDSLKEVISSEDPSPIFFNIASGSTNGISFNTNGEQVLDIKADSAMFKGEAIPKDANYNQSLYNAFTEWLQIASNPKA